MSHPEPTELALTMKVDNAIQRVILTTLAAEAERHATGDGPISMPWEELRRATGEPFGAIAEEMLEMVCKGWFDIRHGGLGAVVVPYWTEWLVGTL